MGRDDLVQISKDEMQVLLRQAAKEGAAEALKGVGLHDEQAGADVRDLRTLLDAFRQVRRAAWSTVGKLLTFGLLGLLAFLSGKYHFWSGQ